MYLDVKSMTNRGDSLDDAYLKVVNRLDSLDLKAWRLLKIYNCHLKILCLELNLKYIRLKSNPKIK